MDGSFVEELVDDESKLRDMADAWVEIEDHPEIIEAEVEEAFEELERMESLLVTTDDDSEPEAAEEDTEEVAATPEISSLEGEELVRKLKASAPGWGLPSSATAHLDLFLKEMRNARAAAPKKDTTMHSFFKKARKEG